MKPIKTPLAPPAIGPFSQAMQTGNFVFLSGQLGMNLETKALVPGLEPQIEQLFKNMMAVLDAAGLGLKDIVKTTVFLSDMNNFATLNTIYARHFGDHKPARSTVQVARLPIDALVEMECIAVRE
ncbi:MAG TPA: RidA family protein [Kiritimatiellia bacterium]|nr:RidA family protein [Kiritimatiellia bacterium]HNS81363.1 RidA family protein [Kiritimatiellia bacterium]HPA78467.1 RidA family protein [Kiritimatiellia bacterium]HQQ04714.1 RidA family protein [Kiritimatiellia bacterium]